MTINNDVTHRKDGGVVGENCNVCGTTTTDSNPGHVVSVALIPMSVLKCLKCITHWANPADICVTNVALNGGLEYTDPSYLSAVVVWDQATMTYVTLKDYIDQHPEELEASIEALRMSDDV